jgi:uncharacterized membrane protein
MSSKSRRNRAKLGARAAMVTTHQYSGPIPPASQLAQYGQIREDFPDRILKLAESNALHRQGLEARVVFGNLDAQKRGQWFAFILSLVVIGVGAWLVYNGKTSTGLWVIFGDVLILAGVFIGVRWIQKKERSARRDELQVRTAT